MAAPGEPTSRQQQLAQAVHYQSHKFEENYRWLEKAMPAAFFEELAPDVLTLVTHNLINLELQGFFTTINLKRLAVILCLDSPDADLRILEAYANYGIKNYRAYVSTMPLIAPGITKNLRIGILYFTEAVETIEKPFPETAKEELRALVHQRNPEVTDEEFNKLIASMNTRFLRALPLDRLILALDMFFRAKGRDNCQYEVRNEEDWAAKDVPSMQVVLAWRNTPKNNFLYRIARTIHQHGLVMKRVNATYIDPYSKSNVLVMALGLHGSNGQAAWDAADIVDFLRELVTIKYFDAFDLIDRALVSKGIVSGCMGNLLRCMVNFIHQTLVPLDSHLYRIENIEEGLCRHPELTVLLCQLFTLRLDPDHCNVEKYEKARSEFLELVSKFDTGQEENDIRRRNILAQGANMIHHTLRTNFYRRNYTAISFRLDPTYLDHVPFDRKTKFPEMPYGIYFIKGMHFFAFHVRFKELARGGLRTVYPELVEKTVSERNSVFAECYNLAYTQHKKNKDIPEGGAKGVIFLETSDQLDSETAILERELINAKIDEREIENKLTSFRLEQKQEYLYHAQRSFIESLITVANSHPEGTIKAKYMVDYLKKPEYIFLGPDEGMHDRMIEWISQYSEKYDYMPGGAFITSKPKGGINHKEYGVTSLGVNVYAAEALKYIGINPESDPFTIKMSGGPDGDVAGNEICNLARFYPNTAKLIALTDVSGTIYDPVGLDLSVMVDLFKQGKAIKYYPPQKLNEGGYLVDRLAKREQTALVQQTLCWRKRDGHVVEDWLSGSEMNRLIRYNVHRIPADIFIPAGGRPRTLNDHNYTDFLDESDVPTSRIIVEGANLYLTQEARRQLEKRGCLIIKDSSANKCGVICSSFEVLCNIVISEEEFTAHKPELVSQILDRLRQCAYNEAKLLLDTHRQTKKPLTELSEQISQNINFYTYELLDHLDQIDLNLEPQDPFTRSLLDYCLPLLREKYLDRILQRIPPHHQKAIIACHIASQVVYKKGLDWSPSIVDFLPMLLDDREIISHK